MKIIKTPVIGYNVYIVDDSFEIPEDKDELYDILWNMGVDDMIIEDDFSGDRDIIIEEKSYNNE